MRLLLAAIMITLIAVPAQAQHMRGKKQPSAPQKQSAEQKKEAEKAYKAALDRVPDQKSLDPWTNMR